MTTSSVLFCYLSYITENHFDISINCKKFKPALSKFCGLCQSITTCLMGTSMSENEMKRAANVNGKKGKISARSGIVTSR